MKKVRRFSFSMVELLLVIAVFSILSLLLCTAGEAAKKDAKLAICAANMKELVNKIHLYDAEHGQLPPVWVPAKPLWYFWSKHLDPSPLRNKLFCCPADIRSAPCKRARLSRINVLPTPVPRRWSASSSALIS